MKKILFVAVAGLMCLASCQHDELIELNQGNAISFNSLITKATSTTSSTIADFAVTAQAGATSPYFDSVTFTKNTSGKFVSATDYYWPAEGSLAFYAWNPISNTQVSKTDYKTFTVTPADAAASQVDFIYACTTGKTKANSSAGVTINFRHTESQVLVQFKNTAKNLNVDFTSYSLNYLSKSGKFTFADANTDGQNTGSSTVGTLAATDWSNLSTASKSTGYTVSSSKSAAHETSTAASAGESFILIPQTQSKATVTDNNLDFTTGATITFAVTYTNPNDNTVIYSGNASWPIEVSWAPGYKYTYTVDFKSGGYDDEGDPILDDVIEFVTVTVDEWVDGGSSDVDM